MSSRPALQVMRAHRQRILQRDRVAEVDDGVDVRHALALGDAGEQCLDGTHELVGVDAESAERLSVRQDLRLLLDLLALEMAAAAAILSSSSASTVG